MTTEHINRVNGINLNVLNETVSAIQGDPELGKSRFRARNQWVNATCNRTTISGFYGAKQEQVHQQPFELDADEPPILAGGDEAPNPVEHLLHALASCLTTSIVAHAAVKGIEIKALESELEGDLDLRGFLGLAPEVPKGYSRIRIKFKVQTAPDNIQRLKKLAEFSPVYNTVRRGANIDLEIEPW